MWYNPLSAGAHRATRGGVGRRWKKIAGAPGATGRHPHSSRKPSGASHLLPEPRPPCHGRFVAMAGRQAVGWYCHGGVATGDVVWGGESTARRGLRSTDEAPKPRRQKRRKASWPNRRPVANRGGVAGRHKRHQRSARVEIEVEKGGRLSGGSAPSGSWWRKSHSGPTMALRA